MSWSVVRPFAISGGLTVSRTGSVTFVDGVGTAANITSVHYAVVAVHYVKGAKDILGGPPRVVEATLAMYSEVRFQPSGVNVTGDRFTYDGYTWEVQVSRKWEYADLYYAEASKVP